MKAIGFMYARSTRNRLHRQLARVRSPRYLAAMVLGASYLYWALIRNTRVDGGPLASLVQLDLILPVLSALLLIAGARWWIFGADRGALAFVPAEVQFLFPAPVSRRTLIQAKLLRTQFAILLNVLIFTVLLRGGGGSADSWRRAAALWVGFSVMALHRLGASIVRANALEHARAGWRRSIVPMVVFTALLVALAWGFITQIDALKAAAAIGFKQVGLEIVSTLQQPVPSAALWPVRAVLAPLFTTTPAGWLAAMPWAVAILAAHFLWVLQLDSAFEEAALEATQHRAERIQRFRTSQSGKARSKKGKVARIPRLRLHGRPAMAVAWKNVAAALRGGAWRTQLISFTIGLLVLAVLIRTASTDAADLFVGLVVGWGAMLVFIGPSWMRFDLRLDLPRLTILKTWPLPGKQIVAAEIAAVTLLHSITIWSLMVVPITLVVMDPSLLSERLSLLPVVVAIALGIPLLNALMFTVQNAMALLFPAWVKMGTETRGFETMGQNLLTMGATTIVAAVALVFPAGLGFLVLLFGGDVAGWTLPVATLAGGTILMLELWPVVLWLGDVFDRLDVNDIGSTP